MKLLKKRKKEKKKMFSFPILQRLTKIKGVCTATPLVAVYTPFSFIFSTIPVYKGEGCKKEGCSNC